MTRIEIGAGTKVEFHAKRIAELILTTSTPISNPFSNGPTNRVLQRDSESIQNLLLNAKSNIFLIFNEIWHTY